MPKSIISIPSCLALTAIFTFTFLPAFNTSENDIVNERKKLSGNLSADPVTADEENRTVLMSDRAGSLVIRINYSEGCVIDCIKVNGIIVTDSTCPVFTGIGRGDQRWSSIISNTLPVISVTGKNVTIDSVTYGPDDFKVNEKWIFRASDDSISWRIIRNYSREGKVDDNFLPCWQFRSMHTWDGALLDNGGVAWNRFLSEKGESYGAHARSIMLWNRSENRCLKIESSDGYGLSRVVTFRHQPDDRLSVVQSVSDTCITTRYGLSHYLGGYLKIFAPVSIKKSVVATEYTLKAANYDNVYNRGDLKGVEAKAINEMLNTIGRYGVVDRYLYGSNGWRTGWVVLQEPWLALYGLANNSPEFIKGFSEALEYSAKEAVLPDGRVLPRWHHDSTDAMPGTYRENGFYECKWGYMLDTQPAFAINVAEQFDITGDIDWLRRLSPVCEKALDYMIRRDSDNDCLFEVIQESHREEKGTDWLDVIWASHEVSTINAYMFMALTRWSELEKLLGNDTLAEKYGSLADKLKTSFNKNTSDGGFWDPSEKCYIHWREKDGMVYGNNMNNVVNFLAIGYGLCDDKERIKSILDRTEDLMQKEKLFIWPSCFFPYGTDLGLSVNYPFPDYENGDLFLAWAELGTRCYAGYNPDIAMKYIRKVIEQYEKDGLSFQRYTRVKQTGAGDDILSNNIMAVAGLYRNIYGIRPQYNRLYLDPHLIPELNGTEFNYYLRGQKYSIKLSIENYFVSAGNYSVSDSQPFAINLGKSGLEYFMGNYDRLSMKLSSEGMCSLKILKWNPDNMIWNETVSAGPKIINHELMNLEPGRNYRIEYNGKKIRIIKSDSFGMLRFISNPGKQGLQISIKLSGDANGDKMTTSLSGKPL